MTAPDGQYPDGAYTLGGRPNRFGQADDEAAAKNAMTAKPKADYLKAFDLFGQQRRQVAATRAQWNDQQLNFRNRLDLLDDVTGYGTAFMGYNWNIPNQQQWVALPFEQQLGPAKAVEVVKPQPNSGWLLLKKGGLWRIDAHVTTGGYTQSSSIIPTIYPPYFIIITNYNPIAPSYMIEVFNSKGLITARQFDAVLPFGGNNGGFVPTPVPSSSAFTHTFVLEDMPPADDPTAPEHWAHVRVSMLWRQVDTGQLNIGICESKGGTARSGLTASRWTREVQNAIAAPTVPDGGTLTA